LHLPLPITTLKLVCRAWGRPQRSEDPQHHGGGCERDHRGRTALSFAAEKATETAYAIFGRMIGTL
jgi:hypothetical protein